MTAVNPLHPSASALRDSRPYEPSMEEILASIRRIIADDQSLPGRSGTLEELRSEMSPSIEAPMVDPVSSPVHVLHPSAEARNEAALTIEAQSFETQSFVAHGPIAAPQYASPEGPFVAGEEPVLAAVASTSKEDAARLPARDPAPVIEALGTQDVSVTEATAMVPAPASDPHDQSEQIEDTRVAALDRSNALFSAATDESVAAAFQALAASRLADNTDDLLAMTRDMIRPLLKTWLDDNLPSMVERLVRAEIERVARGTR